ncbi:unnamed protein product [Ostreobium quekettii]|uniref:MYND-type domain-containing protein n=1 Tax=Ostreobium quekettii TaxID=121088 RepID=A0A8S1ISQ6_9CHLO|nr:unnamed protein product [Ostreobium quekettii]|eukprot:evm.model.scf_772EXC.3 EVM.evm.TU.scf_772EXC.3   scf_772EXC:26342-28779(-)
MQRAMIQDPMKVDTNRGTCERCGVSGCLRRCPKCDTAFYCSRKCERTDARRHRAECQAIADGEGDEGGSGEETGTPTLGGEAARQPGVEEGHQSKAAAAKGSSGSGEKSTVSKQLTCHHCGTAGAKKKCGGCNKTFYCSRECQRQDWKRHRKECNQDAKPGAKATAPLSAAETGQRLKAVAEDCGFTVTNLKTGEQAYEEYMRAMARSTMPDSQFDYGF